MAECPRALELPLLPLGAPGLHTPCSTPGRRLVMRRVAKLCSLRRTFHGLLLLGILGAIWLYLQTLSPWNNRFRQYRTQLQVPNGMCLDGARSHENSSWADNQSFGQIGQDFRRRKSGRVLLFTKTTYSGAIRTITETLVANRIKYKATDVGKSLPDLIKVSKGVGKYGVVFFEDFRAYLDMDDWNRDILDKYCKMFKVGIVALVPTSEFERGQLTPLQDRRHGRPLPLAWEQQRTQLSNLTVNVSSSMLRLTRGGQTLYGDLSGRWGSFQTTNPNYGAVAWTQNPKDLQSNTVVLQDFGQLDGIRKVLFGGPIGHWVNILLFLDSLSWLSQNRISISLTRYVLVDIDDIFVGKNRLYPDDVHALIESQTRIRKMVPGFTYNLGFSGGYFHHGNRLENAGDDLLIAQKDQFWWFPHMWLHQQAHLFQNLSSLEQSMAKNKVFAQAKGIALDWNYSVAPHHSGVYPVHEHLYELWKSMWDIKVTSTEEYPHLRPARLRHGFVYSGIKVLPRQTCGLFTKNLYYDEYPGGPEVLEASIHGGELFQTIVYNPISIFMTHMPNYCNDRLAPYAFESVITMVQCWTNLDLRTRNPKALGDIYFEMFPEETQAVWGNPCDDKRHMEIWSKTKDCSRLPDFLVIGPQKTGTTALYTFLQMHPHIESNFPSPKSFEEVQFFSGDNYAEGVDWYLNFFPNRSQESPTFLFEKSATYFDRELVPLRAFRLLPKAQLVVILISSSKRAYSWYQHQRAHDDPTALKYSFHEVISADSTAPKQLRQLQSRCLDPGKYVDHIERWLAWYPSQRVHIINGDELAKNPVFVLNQLQHSLNIKPLYDYTGKLVFDEKKGFFCEAKDNGKAKCLGQGKGRKYAPMSPESQSFLKKIFQPHNEALAKLLKRLGYLTPHWLELDLKDGFEVAKKESEEDEVEAVEAVEEQ
eukprot:maker-scaffold60_size442463-snap-gene-0.29 protein:Tk12066 transcript:maker-scaffold60_size442463-snap-gene-0.29-mRNA-1 annotation:"heparan sulfate n-deacetylase n-sulfotransferase"